MASTNADESSDSTSCGENTGGDEIGDKGISDKAGASDESYGLGPALSIRLVRDQQPHLEWTMKSR